MNSGGDSGGSGTTAAADTRALARLTAADLPVFLSWPAPRGRLETFLRAAAPGPWMLWHPPAGPSFAGSGVAWTIAPKAEAGLAAVRERAAALWTQLGLRAGTGEPSAWPGGARAPRFFGGVAFDPSRPATGDWDAFPPVSFTLPRWTYARDGERSWLGLAVTEESALAERARLMGELERIWTALEKGAAEGPGPSAGPLRPAAVPGPAPTVRERFEQARWREAVQAVLADIERGALAKVVLARATDVEFSQPIEPLAVLERLAADQPGTCHFGFGAFGPPGRERAFVGASPERLLGKRDRMFVSDPIAGSASAGEARSGGSFGPLLTSRKELAEHALVVSAIQAGLAPFCARLDIASRPDLLELPDVTHLHTAIWGELAGPAHVLDLVAAIHPTPAVAGVPRAAALDAIAALEPEPRGWYAGAVGWFDAAGDGDFVLGLRSALLSGPQARLYAGAGTVAGSEAEAEYAETAVKQRALMRALGVSG